jgi:phage/plasmid-like protein (TIGR03299 family)
MKASKTILANPSAMWEDFAFAEFSQAEIGFEGVNGLPKLTVADALARRGMDWTPELYQAQCQTPYGLKTFENHNLVCRSDNGEPIGHVGGVYQGIPNTQALSVLDDMLALVPGSGIIGARETDGGAKAHVLAVVGKPFSPTGDDDYILPTVLMRGSHDGSSPVVLLDIPTRGFCWNTNIWHNGGVGEVKVRHSGDIQAKLNTARELVTAHVETMGAFEAWAKAQVKAKMNKVAAEAFLEKLLPTPADVEKKKAAATIAESARERILGLFTNGADLQNIKGTQWGMFQAVCDYADHDSRVRLVNGREEGELRFLKATTFSPIKDLAAKLLTV